jgi:Flp pilus assembly protein protease CpaA
MTPDRLLGLGLLIALLLPSLVALSERRRLHDMFRALLALAGLGFCWATGGTSGLLLGLCSSLGVLLLLTMLVAFTQKLFDARILSGGEIKQLAAGAAWLYPHGAVVYLITVIGFALVAGVVAKHFSVRVRNEVMIAASSVMLLLIFLCSR